MVTPQPSFLRYLAVVAGAAIAAAVVSFLLAVIADPYRIFGSERFLPSPALKPRIYQQEDLAKRYMFARTPGKTLILGNSRVDIGIDPGAPAWPARYKPVFNGGLSGKDLFGSLVTLRHAVAERPPELVVLGIDFQDFIQHQTYEPMTSDMLRLDEDSKQTSGFQSELHRVEDILSTTITLDALTDSLTTLLVQDRRYGETLFANGLNPLRPYKKENPVTLFNAKLADYQRDYGKFHPDDFSKPALNPEFGYLASIMRVCADRHIRLIIFIHPYHALYLQMLHAHGLWSSFESWKRALVAFVGARDPHVMIFDFANYNAASREALPPGELKRPMQWYWEPGHYKAALGNLVVRDIFASRPRYGVRIDATNIDKEISSIRLRASQYEKTQLAQSH